MKNISSYIYSWLVFIKERFEPISHILMIVVLTLYYKNNIDTPIHNIIVIIFFNFLVFFKMRLYDEIKDYQTDLTVNPTRPLPRGLLSFKDIFWAIGICTSLELHIIIAYSFNPLLALILIIYLYLMYKEFFIGEIISKHLSTYALMHTLVCVVIGFINLSFYQSLSEYSNFFGVLAIWPLFNIFEFGRKSFQPSEERKNVTTYTSQFGKLGACSLLFSQMLAYNFFVYLYSNSYNLLLSNIFLLALALITMVYFIKSTSITAAKCVRSISTLYLILSLILVLVFANNTV